MERLNELGYREGRNMTFEYRSADGRSERLPQLAMELVRGGRDVLIAGFGTLAAQAKDRYQHHPDRVFTTVGDPVGAGSVASLGSPGGNVTGVSGLTQIGGSSYSSCNELAPGKQTLGVLLNPETPFSRLALKEIKPLRTARVPVSRFSRLEPPNRYPARSRQLRLQV